MADIKAFKGFRPAKEYANRVASPPYDVLSEEEARAIFEENPHSFLQVIRSEVSLSKNVNPYSKEVYEQAKRNFNRLVEDGILIQDSSPCFYIYKQKMGLHQQSGIVAISSVQDYFKDIIKKHEFTRPEKEKDRTTHMKVTGIHSGPVFLTYPEVSSIDNMVKEICKGEPDYDFVLEDGIGHSLWVVRDEAIIEEIQFQFKENVPFTYIADGHHRAASSANIGRDTFGAENPGYFLTVIFPANQLKIIDYNRVVKDLNGLDEKRFFKIISSNFEIEDSPIPCKPRHLHEFGMYVNNKWFKLIAKEGSFDSGDPVRKLDASILQENILSKVFGIKDPRTDDRIDFVGGIRGIDELERRVDSGEMRVAFSLFPVSIQQLIDIANSGKVMPPKSTWFEPKLRSGMVVHKFK